MFVWRLLVNTGSGVLLLTSLAWSESVAELSTSALQHQGIAYRLKGDYVGATRVSDQLKGRFPDDAIGYTFNLNTLITRFSWDLSDKQFDSEIVKDAGVALEICESHIDSDPSDYRAFYHCGQAHFALAYLHAARGHYYRAGTNGSATIENLVSATEFYFENDSSVRRSTVPQVVSNGQDVRFYREATSWILLSNNC